MLWVNNVIVLILAVPCRKRYRTKCMFECHDTRYAHTYTALYLIDHA